MRTAEPLSWGAEAPPDYLIGEEWAKWILVSTPGGAEPPVHRSGGVELDVPEPSILRILFHGHVDGPVVEEAVHLAREHLIRAPARVVVFDTMGVTSFDGSVRRPGIDLLRALKAAGVGSAVVAVVSKGIRLVGVAVSITARFPLAFFVSVEQAMARARELAGDHGKTHP
jgi:hypothetical protein